MNLRRRPRGEDGSALLIALIFATVFSLFVASVVSFTEVGLLASKGYEARAKSAYAVDGAVNAAINRYGASEPCDDFTAPVGPGGEPINGQGVVVHCAAGTRVSTPVNALLSLGDVPGEEGIDSTSDQRVLGNIVSNSSVRSSGTLVVQGEVSAQGGCSPLPRIQTAPPVPLHCSNANPPADPGLGRDPDYTRASEVVPVRRTVDACPADPDPRIVRLRPGYYDDSELMRLNALTNGACIGVVVWFRPGLYYLDFTFLHGAPDPAAGRWTVTDSTVRVIGGTPAGWDDTDLVPAPTGVPGTCDLDRPGVQIVMGGQGTRLEVVAGKVEVCAEPVTTDQQIAIFGVRAGLSSHLLAPTVVSGPTGFTGTTHALTIGEQPPSAPTEPLTAVAVLSQGSPSASITLSGFKPAIPTGSVIDAAVLEVAHKDDAGVSSVTVSATGETPGPGCASTPHVLSPSPTLTVESIDLKACGLTTAAAYQDLAVTYTASTAGATAVSDHHDGVAVEVRYRPPTTRKPTVVAGSSGFADPDRALEIGDRNDLGDPLTAKAVLGGVTTSASITLGGLSDPPLPPGSTIDAAVLRVAHQDTGDAAPGTATLTAGTCTALPLPAYPTGGEDRVDLKATCGTADAAALAGLTATFQVNLAAGASEATHELDGMWLELVYTPPLVTLLPATATSPGGFGPVAAATAIDGTTADAVLPSGPTNSRSASLTVSGFTPPTPVDRLGLDTAVVRVRHQDDGAAGPVTVTAAWTGGVGGSCSATFAPHPGTPIDDRLDLRTCGLGDRLLDGLSVTYTTVVAARGGTATGHLDGIVLDVAYAPAAARTAAAVSGSSGFVDPANARLLGEAPTPLTADAAPGVSAASFTLGGFDQPRLPAGAAVDSAVLRVVHQDDGPIGTVGLTASFPGAGVPCGNLSLPLRPGAPGQDAVDLTPCGLREASQIAALTATYTVAATADTTRPAANVSASSGFVDATNALGIDGTVATAALDTTASAPAAASLTLEGYDVNPPAGATVDSAVLKVVHRDDAPIGPVTVSASWTGGTCVTTIPSRASALGEDLISLKRCGLADLADLAELEVTYTATLTPAGATASDLLDGIALSFVSDRVDGVVLDVVFRTPTFRPLSGCHTAGPYPVAGCALVKVAAAPGDTATAFASKGTIYAPSAVLDIAMNGLKAQVLTRGLLARAIRVGLAADPAFKRPTGGVPPEAVVFTAYPEGKVRNDVRATSAEGFPGANNANALIIGEVPAALTADAVIDTATPPLARTILLTGYAEPTLPAGTAIDGAVLRIAHRDDAGIQSATVTVSFNGNACASPEELPLHVTDIGEDQVDLRACGFRTADQLAGLSVSYTVTADPGASGTVTDQLDGIVLVLRHGPMLRASVTFDRGRATVREWSVLR